MLLKITIFIMRYIITSFSKQKLNYFLLTKSCFFFHIEKLTFLFINDSIVHGVFFN
jgi:hypothetical protein